MWHPHMLFESISLFKMMFKQNNCSNKVTVNLVESQAIRSLTTYLLTTHAGAHLCFGLPNQGVCGFVCLFFFPLTTRPVANKTV